MSTETKPVKKPTAKAIFKGTNPVESKNVIVYFDRVFRIYSRTKFVGSMKQLDGNMGVMVRHPDHGDDVFMVPYQIGGASITTKAMESSLRGALKARKLEIVPIDELKPSKK